MNIDTDLSIPMLIWQASLPVQIVVGLLFLVSMMSWCMIFRRFWIYREARVQGDQFEGTFWSAEDLQPLYQQIQDTSTPSNGGMAHIFEMGFKEFSRLRDRSGMQPMDVVEGAQRAMRAALSREEHYLETHLSFLATVGSTSPYVGLFGTVWGIMSSFMALGNVQHATIAMVAPGIAEALIATAIGLFAAIPAVVAYNQFATEVDKLTARYSAFVDEFSSILQRLIHDFHDSHDTR